MRPPVEEPRLVKEDPVHGTTYAHPAFGMIGGARVSSGGPGGGAVLFGSDFKHHNFIILRIARAQLHRNLARDWHHSHEQLIEVALSEAQWATFVSTLNVGDGVPCTLNRVVGHSMPEIPLRQEREVVRGELDDNVAELLSSVQNTIAKVEALPGMSAKRRKELLSDLVSLEQNLRANMPWYVKQFEAHMEKTVETAKVEVAAYVQSAVSRAGLEALGGKPPLTLTSGEEPTNDRP